MSTRKEQKKGALRKPQGASASASRGRKGRSAMELRALKQIDFDLSILKVMQSFLAFDGRDLPLALAHSPTDSSASVPDHDKLCSEFSSACSLRELPA